MASRRRESNALAGYTGMMVQWCIQLTRLTLACEIIRYRLVQVRQNLKITYTLYWQTMVQTSKTDHFFKLAPFWSPLTDLIDFGMAGKLLTSATRRCSPFVDSVKSLIGCWAPTATTFGQSAPPRVQQTAGRNGHNRHFERMSLVSSVCRSFCTGKIELYVSWVAYFRGVLPWLQRTAVTPVGFACTGAISRVIAKVTSSSDRPRKNTRTQQIYASTSWQISTTGSSSNPQQTVLRALI